MIHHQPQAPARAQVLVQGEPNVEVEVRLGKERDEARIAAGDAALNEADAEAGADRRDLRELAVDAQRELERSRCVAPTRSRKYGVSRSKPTSACSSSSAAIVVSGGAVSR